MECVGGWARANLKILGRPCPFPADPTGLGGGGEGPALSLVPISKMGKALRRACVESCAFLLFS